MLGEDVKIEPPDITRIGQWGITAMKRMADVRRLLSVSVKDLPMEDGHRIGLMRFSIVE